MKTSKINNVRIKPIITSEQPIDKIGAFRLFPEIYCNTAIIAKKKIGQDISPLQLFRKMCK